MWVCKSLRTHRGKGVSPTPAQVAQCSKGRDQGCCPSIAEHNGALLPLATAGADLTPVAAKIAVYRSAFEANLLVFRP